MRPRRPEGDPSDDLFRARLTNQLDLKDALIRLSGLINWESFETGFADPVARAHRSKRDGTAARRNRGGSDAGGCGEIFQP